VAGCKSRTKYSRLFAERKIQNNIPSEPLADFEAHLTTIKHKYHLLETSASHSLIAYQRKRKEKCTLLFWIDLNLDPT
jgi:hypothetical protein